MTFIKDLKKIEALLHLLEIRVEELERKQILLQKRSVQLGLKTAAQANATERPRVSNP